MKKSQKYPSIIISATNEDRQILENLKTKYHINVSSFIRDQIRKLHEKLEKENNTI